MRAAWGLRLRKYKEGGVRAEKCAELTTGEKVQSLVEGL
jgi:hypothetical protein